MKIFNPIRNKKGQFIRAFDKHRIKRICEFCGKEFEEFESRIKEEKGKFCSRECYTKYRKKIHQVQWYPLKGIRMSLKTEFKKGEKRISGKNNFNWKGDNVGYDALHTWLRRKKGKPKECIKCGGTEKIQWANKDWKYRRNVNDWISLCLWCHKKYDMQNWGAAARRFIK